MTFGLLEQAAFHLTSAATNREREKENGSERVLDISPHHVLCLGTSLSPSTLTSTSTAAKGKPCLCWPGPRVVQEQCDILTAKHFGVEVDSGAFLLTGGLVCVGGGGLASCLGLCRASPF